MFLDLPVVIAIGVSVARFIYAKRSVIKSRTKPFTVALYPLAKHQEDVKPLHGKRVHVIVIAEE
jgi:hypothetical protein